jgi:hypothetical protein
MVLTNNVSTFRLNLRSRLTQTHHHINWDGNSTQIWRYGGNSTHNMAPFYVNNIELTTSHQLHPPVARWLPLVTAASLWCMFTILDKINIPQYYVSIRKRLCLGIFPWHVPKYQRSNNTIIFGGRCFDIQQAS